MAFAYQLSEPIYTEQEYLTRERAAEERSEYLDGVIYAMPGESVEHGRISVNLVLELGNQLRNKPCDVFTKDMKVRSGPLPQRRFSTKGLFSYPDVVVVCGKLQALDEHQDVIVNPTVIIEVLSESTQHFDRVAKFQRYQKHLPTLRDYVLVSQTEPLIEHYHRDADTTVWQYVSVNELKGAVQLLSIKCRLRLAEVYNRITFPRMAKPAAKAKAKKTGVAKANAGKKSVQDGKK
ncbi:MAG TPA: Uma2 family endonuclease [Blastocatellia bacterium]|nr:Uma2 family endonuclease [Blastocatellia bacterium]HMV86780.1 Uma2 family endonuclease [Blastocatellia bacterium]HMX25436.1 Uma2 family endonuclease [Blastocatellia bacterium]HMY72158.1 Uma2 family endonuclease [Blastocatellia bacterium]HMZ19484.1 Uma2 family endonuclease [Blastocatellia bacterium]